MTIFRVAQPSAVRQWCALVFVITIAAVLGSCGGGKKGTWECTATAIVNGINTPLAQGADGKWGFSFIPTSDEEDGYSNATQADLACEQSISMHLEQPSATSNISCTCTESGTTPSHSPLVPSRGR